MRLLVWDLVRRLKWLCAGLAFVAFALSLAVFGRSHAGPGSGGALDFVHVPVFFLGLMSWSLLLGEFVSPWLRVARTMPVTRNMVSTAVWVSFAVVPGLVAWLSILIALPFQPLIRPYPEPSFGLLDMPLVLLFALGSGGAGFFLALYISALLGYSHVVRRGWPRILWFVVGAVCGVLLAFGVIDVVLNAEHRHVQPIFPRKLALFIELFLAVVSYRFRGLIVRSSLDRTFTYTPPKPSQRKTLQFPSLWWSTWRWHVVAACVVLALWAFAHVFVVEEPLVAEGLRPRGGPFPFLPILAFSLPVLTVSATVAALPLRLHRSLPLSSLRFVLRLLTFPVVVHGAFLVGALPLARLGFSHLLPYLMCAWLSFGAALVFLAFVLWLPNRPRIEDLCTFTPPALCFAFVSVDSILVRAIVATVFTVAGAWGLYGAVKWSDNLCRADFRLWR